MNRTFLLVSGAICWTAVAGDALVHAVNGDVLVPMAMAAVFAVWVSVRRLQTRRRVTA